jgi:hypothetical protein
MVGHKIDLKVGHPEVGNYTLLKETITAVIQAITHKFPNALIIPTFGNNDAKYHYQALASADRSDYYAFNYNAWFTATNKQVPNIASVKSTFLKGGYYRVDLTSTLTVLALDTLYW